MIIIKKLTRYLLILLVTLMLFSPFWIKNIPLKYLSFLTGKTTIIDKYVCRYSIEVSGDSMSPIINQGGSIELNRCFDESDLTEGVIILFNKDSELHLAIIRHVLPLNPVVYKISNERPQERLQDIIKEEIVAINKNIDTSKSQYQPSQTEESFILDPEEYLSDLYLGKIPRGSGIEMAKVEKTNTFSKNNDKFCFVVIPKKELALVDIEIVETKSQKVMVSSKNIVFNPSPNPNINCQDFGSNEGMLNLNTGNYYYKFLLNHQTLANIPFSVK